jgi:very-short-patch-repair endonuclease
MVGVNIRTLVHNAKLLRRNMTDAERLLWKHLRSKQVAGMKFRRQEPIGQYIVDFVSFEKKIIVEVDGGQHSEQREKDRERDRWLKTQGFVVLRFWNHEVLQHVEVVVESISDRASTLPNPSH